MSCAFIFADSSGHLSRTSRSSVRSSSRVGNFFGYSIIARWMCAGRFPNTLGNVAATVSKSGHHFATVASTSRFARSCRSRNSIVFVEMSVPMPTLKPCDTGRPL